MSAAIDAVSSVSTSSVTAEPTAGAAATQAIAGETFVITDSAASTDPVAIDIASTVTEGTVNLAVATTNAQLSVTGEGTATLSIGGANDASGNALDQSGAVIGIDDSYAGKVVANFSAAYVSSDATVDATAKVGGSTSTIGENAPAGSVAGVNLYVNTGTGADEIGGSDKNDFVRAGAGDDEVNAGSGDDIVRLGVGSDKASLGGGDDSLYMTVDQFGDGNVNTVTDFDSSGDDKLLFNNDIKDLLTITGQGTNTLTLTLSGDQASTVTFTSEGGTFDADDIEFV